MDNVPVNVPVDHPDADTEWNDILRKHKIIPEKPPSPTPLIEAAILEARRLAHENRLEGKNLDELDELEDEEDEEFLQHYRNQRLAELSTLSTASIYNQVYPIQKPDYARDVTEVSKTSFVFVLLISSLGTNTESAVLITYWRDLAARFGDIKFCQMQANLCIEGYPERNTPTVLVYKDGDIKKQIVTLKEINGQSTSLQDMEKVLLEVGAVKRNDARLQTTRQDDGTSARNGGIRSAAKKTTIDDDDSDWD